MSPDVPTRSPNLNRLIAGLTASGIPYSDETLYWSDVEGVVLHDARPPGGIIYEVLVMASDAPTDADRVPWLPRVTRFLYRFIAGDPTSHPRTEICFDEVDTIIDVIKADLAAYKAAGALVPTVSSANAQPSISDDF